jgi:hypothetical protein
MQKCDKKSRKGDLRTRVSENESEILSMPFLVFDPLSTPREKCQRNVRVRTIEESFERSKDGNVGSRKFIFLMT